MKPSTYSRWEKTGITKKQTIIHFQWGMRNEVRKRKRSHSGSPRTQSPISFQYVLELEKAGSQNKVPKNNYAKTSTLFPSLTTLNNKGGDYLYSEVMTLRDLVSKMSDDLSKIIFELEYQVNTTIWLCTVTNRHGSMNNWPINFNQIIIKINQALTMSMGHSQPIYFNLVS